MLRSGFARVMVFLSWMAEYFCGCFKSSLCLLSLRIIQIKSNQFPQTTGCGKQKEQKCKCGQCICDVHERFKWIKELIIRHIGDNVNQRSVTFLLRQREKKKKKNCIFLFQSLFFLVRFQFFLCGWVENFAVLAAS